MRKSTVGLMRMWYTFEGYDRIVTEIRVQLAQS